MPPTKNQLVHGSRISCEIDGVKIDDARMENFTDYWRIVFTKNSVTERRTFFAEELTSDKYKIRLVEEEKEGSNSCKDCNGLKVKPYKNSVNLKFCECHQDTEVITVKRWGTLSHNGLMLGTFKHKEHAMFGQKKGLIPVELTISYSLPKLKEITKSEAENLLEGKYKII